MQTQECLVVVVGAGASYDCMTEHPPNADLDAGINMRSRYVDGPSHSLAAVRLPLTEHLAALNPYRNEILKRYPRAGVVVARLQQAIRFEGGADPLETQLRIIQREADGDPQLGAAMAQFRCYLRDLMLESVGHAQSPDANLNVTNYLHLADMLRRWAKPRLAHICYVNFNYDPLLDLALNDVYGMDFTGPDAHQLSDEVSLLRPHGSALWEWHLKAAPGVHFSPRTRISRANTALAGLASGTLWSEPCPPTGLDASAAFKNGETSEAIGIPALALPVDHKDADTLVWPAEQEAHLVGLDRQAPVRRLLTVGWRGEEPHVLPMLAGVIAVDSPALLVISGSDHEAKAIADRLEADIRVTGIKSQPVGSGFGGAIRDGHLAHWLR